MKTQIYIFSLWKPNNKSNGCKISSLMEPIARENEGKEREAPDPALGICHVHESYFKKSGSLCSSKSLSSETSACRPTSVWYLKEKQRFYVMGHEVDFLFSLRTWERGNTACRRLGRQTSAGTKTSSKNNFRGHDITRPTPWASFSVLSFSLDGT